MASPFKQSRGKSLFGFVGSSSSVCRIEATFFKAGTQDPLDMVHLKALGRHLADDLPVLRDSSGGQVSGQVRVTATQGKLEHQGVRVQLMGIVELTNAGIKKQELLSLSRELTGAGEIRGEGEYSFAFASVDTSIDSYRGNTVRLSYLLRVTIARGLGGVSEDFPLWVENSCKESPPQEQIKLEVGIENCLHLEFTYGSGAYGLTDVVTGAIHFKLVKIALKTMELEVRRRETTNASSKAPPDVATLFKFELMDGAPVRGEVLPVRLHLAPLPLTPTYVDVANKFSVRYLLNLVLVDSEDRRYFKSHEVTLVRRPPGAEALAAPAPSEE